MRYNSNTFYNNHKNILNKCIAINFQLPETQALHLETRLVQLDTAIAIAGMELCKKHLIKAFKVEDIHAFTTISKKTPKTTTISVIL